MNDTKRKCGFAAMNAEQQREIARKGGKAAHEQRRAHEFTSEEARVAGAKGGNAVATDREHMAEIGRRGGEAVSANREHMAAIGKLGGQAVARNRDHMVEIGKRGGAAKKATREAA